MAEGERPEGLATLGRGQGRDLEGLCLLEEHDRSDILTFTAYLI